MELTTGSRLQSQVCTTEVIVVKAPKRAVEITCGGAALAPIGSPRPADAVPAAGLDGGTLLGKRYTTDDDDVLELLVTKAGAGSLADGATPLVLKEAKALPASD